MNGTKYVRLRNYQFFIIEHFSSYPSLSNFVMYGIAVFFISVFVVEDVIIGSVKI